MSSLPSLVDVKLDHEGRSIWPYILEAERAALKVASTKPGPKYNDPLIGIRVLGFLLQDLWLHDKHSFNLIPYKNLIKHITLGLSMSGHAVGSEEESHARSKKLQDMGLYYRNHLIRVCSSYIHRLLGCNLTFLQSGPMEARAPRALILLLARPWTLFEIGFSAKRGPQRQKTALVRM